MNTAVPRLDPGRTRPMGMWTAIMMTAVLALATPLRGATPRPFAHASSEDGLSNDTVYAFAQDHDGFIWIATGDGLNRFDGERYRIFEHEPDDPATLSGSSLSMMIVDRRGGIWVATWGGGVDLIDPRKGVVAHYKHDPAEPDGIGDDRVQTLFEDAGGRIWIGTFSGGLTRLDPKDGAMSRWTTSSPSPLSGNRIWSIGAAPDGALLVATGSGLDRLDPDTGEVQALAGAATGIRTHIVDRTNRLWIGAESGLHRYRLDGAELTPDALEPNLAAATDDLPINGFLEDHNGTIWIATRTTGLLSFNPDDGRLERFEPDPHRNGRLRSGDIRALFEDRSHVLWVGTRGTGLHRLDLKPRKFHAFVHDMTDESTVSPGVADFLELEPGRILIGTDNGVELLDARSGEITHLWADESNRMGRVRDVTAFYRDSEGTIWIGTWFDGLFAFAVHGAVRQYDSRGTPDSLGDEHVTAITEGHGGTLWVGTIVGLDLLEPGRGVIKSYRHDPANESSLTENYVTDLYRDADGILWVGTDNAGLNRFDPATGSFQRFRRGVDPTRSLLSDRVRAIVPDRVGRLWIGTWNGLSRLEPRSGTFEHFGTESGLPHPRINGIVADEQGSLWVGTSRGLAHFDPNQANVIRTYASADGLHASAISSGYRDSAGDIYIGGGVIGFSSFDPERVLNDPFPPLVEFTGLWTSANPAGESREIRPGDAIQLSHEMNTFTIGYAALDFTSPDRNEYAYRLEGLDRGWVFAGRRRFATYSSVPPGEYVFRVRGANPDGVWNEAPISLDLRVTPPLWQTIPARLAFLGLVGLSILGVHQLRTRQIQKRNRDLADLVALRTREIQEYSAKLADHAKTIERANRRILEADKAKSTFLAMMSHELRTPLNSIIGFSEILSRRWSDRAEERELGFLGNVMDSGHHLLNLINNLLDLSKIESGKMEVHVEPIALASLIEGVCDVVSGVASKRNISIKPAVTTGLPLCQADTPKLKQILYNLISNATKFSPDRGTVTVEARFVAEGASSLGVDAFEISVTDQGPGVSEEDRALIFEEFRQSKAGSLMYGGTGLGLAIVRKLVEVQGGVVELESAPGEGATFRVLLPARVRESRRQVVPVAEGVGRRVLVVEDDETYRVGLVRLLEDAGYQVACVSRGEEVFEAVHRFRPSVITLDIILPGMDGWQVLKTLKADPEISGVPVVIVTVAADRELALALGADDLFVKPIRNEDLLGAVRSIIADDDAHTSILVIDDDPNVHEMVRSLLVPRGYEVISAFKGQMGLDLAVAIQPSLVLVDLVMPLIDGFEVAARLREHPATSSIPLIALTSKDLSAAEREMLSGRIHALIAKGQGSLDALVKTIQELERRSVRRAVG